MLGTLRSHGKIDDVKVLRIFTFGLINPQFPSLWINIYPERFYYHFASVMRLVRLQLVL